VVLVAGVAGVAGVRVVVEVREGGEDEERHGIGRRVAQRVRRRGGTLHVVVRARGRVEEWQLMVARAIGRRCHDDVFV
jgi:NAD(P)-dependent dehydrogenase (short-subunit alcohol dehydrogenase family)